MKIVLCSIDNKLHDAWGKYCGDLEFVTFHQGSILDVSCDAVVSPANSFGFMDGGLDAVYMDYFGEQIQTRVREKIYEFHNGELIVGVADIVESGDGKIPFLIAAPTMRVPMNLHDSVNPYLAARAIFILCKYGKFVGGDLHGNKIRHHVETVAIPGLGTGVGKVSASICAKQMRRAINDILLEQYKMPGSWAEASEEHQLLYTNKPERLQY